MVRSVRSYHTYELNVMGSIIFNFKFVFDAKAKLAPKRALLNCLSHTFPLPLPHPKHFVFSSHDEMRWQPHFTRKTGDAPRLHKGCSTRGRSSWSGDKEVSCEWLSNASYFGEHPLRSPSSTSNFRRAPESNTKISKDLQQDARRDQPHSTLSVDQFTVHCTISASVTFLL